MKKKIGVKNFDINYFKKFEISNTNKILGGAGCQIDYCTYSSHYNTPTSSSGSNQAGLADDGGGTTDETTTVKVTTTQAP